MPPKPDAVIIEDVEKIGINVRRFECDSGTGAKVVKIAGKFCQIDTETKECINGKC